MASSQEVSYTWRDRICPPLCTLPAIGRRHARAQHAKWQPACLSTRNDLAPLLRVYSEQLALISDIVPDASLAVDSSERRQVVWLRAHVHDMIHGDSPGDGGVRNQKPVATPGNCFGAHDYCGLQPRKNQKIFKGLVELPRLHVVGVGPETGIAPLRVVRVATPAPSTTERWQVGVTQAGIDQRPLEVRSGEVRVSRRCGKGANIDKMCRAFSRQQPEKFLERSGRVANREQPSGVHAPRSFPPQLAACPRAG